MSKHPETIPDRKKIETAAAAGAEGNKSEDDPVVGTDGATPAEPDPGGKEPQANGRGSTLDANAEAKLAARLRALGYIE